MTILYCSCILYIVYLYIVVHLAAMEGHSECVRYLVEQLITEKRHQLSLCGTNSSAGHPVLDVDNNLGESPRALAQRFYKKHTVVTIDELLSQLVTSADDDGTVQRMHSVAQHVG